MKKTRFMRGIAVLLALVLVLGAVGVYAATEADAGAADIIAKNVELEDELSLVFAVNPANVQDGDAVYLLVWGAARKDGNYTIDNAAQTQESFATADYTINGVSDALLFKTDKIAVDNFQKVYRVRTCIVRGEDKIYGEVVEYSIADYAIQRLSENDVTEDQAELYYNVLRYALTTDKVLNEGAQVEDNFVIFAANGMTFGDDGATFASIYKGVVPFDTAACVVTNASGEVVVVNGELAPGLYTVTPAN